MAFIIGFLVVVAGIVLVGCLLGGWMFLGVLNKDVAKRKAEEGAEREGR